MSEPTTSTEDQVPEVDPVDPGDESAAEEVAVERLTDPPASDEPETPAPGSDDKEAAAPTSEHGEAAAPSGDDLVEEGDVAADYLEGLLDIVDLDGDIDITVENDRAAVSVIEVNPGDLRELVGADAAVLRALQDLTRLAVARETGHRSRLMLDIAGHRATRRTELQRLAKQSIEEATSSGAPVRLAAMTAFERKVVHDEVAAAGLTSESEGAEPNRYVVITPA